jgi:UDP-N-acetyl-D-glucosamine dehydrogenase
MGLTYKKNIDDLRNSPSLEIYSKLKNYFKKVSYNDEFVKSIKIGKSTEKNQFISSFKNYNAIIILTDHDYINYKKMIKQANLIIDCRNKLKNRKVINL